MAESKYEKYLIRKPSYEVVARDEVTGRQSPSMTYMSNELVPGCNVYLEFGWIWDIPEPNPNIFEHVHEKYDEVVLHIGSDPNNPEDLGAEIEFQLGGQPLKVDRTSAIYVPKGVKHGPLTWKRVTRPHLEMAIILGAGNLAQADPGGHIK
jgi:hypothetical protein